MAERTADFAKRLRNELKTFVRSKGKEVSDRVEESVESFLQAVDEASYQTSLKNVADQFGLKTNEVERILKAHTRVKASK
ncbi:MAG: hypothetical protein A3B86_04795 [Candidatus Yanofskybacteria bacterium RIFCSPHIGHO2_02_FULL_38_22b]|uniref:Uncharacterized protein n=1 Tax=Candidatus Yanofskybacteria bacterium RIFCSPHIGHO2_02_FULL_38_22b TaxID=1802673 RepID=A0A1F8F317_9BACT|nr:MAG: hypothetical protein A2816_01270 [Candidatus Yanofskybacteria bacterium RIFCSPHIGHO2_01_FULL_39_44]OGN07531.1 MAG: hypothetical protein A3B86_04795 [Candidatus Yanofskybacteria bacterium RIFCSPHIGHO2_02_FULL_38_22b]